ncbi:MAG: MarR family winged helix-turn-helix transcriptional regulator [Euzebya sp.]
MVLLRRPASLGRYPSYLATQFSKASQRLLQERLDIHGLRLHHFAVLAAMADLGPSCQQELCDCLDVDKSLMVGLVDDLEERRYLTRERDPQDRRRYRVAITDAGRAMLANLHDAERDCQEALLEPLDHSQRSVLVSLLESVVANADALRLATPAEVSA